MSILKFGVVVWRPLTSCFCGFSSRIGWVCGSIISFGIDHSNHLITTMHWCWGEYTRKLLRYAIISHPEPQFLTLRCASPVHFLQWSQWHMCESMHKMDIWTWILFSGEEIHVDQRLWHWRDGIFFYKVWDGDTKYHLFMGAVCPWLCSFPILVPC